MVLEREDCGNYFIDSETKQIFRMSGWCQEPTAIMENVKTGEQEVHVYNCMNAQKFTRLVEEKK